VPVKLTFRPAVADEADDLVRLVRSAYRETGSGGWTTEAHLVGDERIDAQQLRDKITQPNTLVLCARTDADELVACCELAGRGGGLAYFGMFAVSPTLQAAGIGRQVLAAAEQTAREQWGAHRMEMTVIAQRDELIAWYRRRGYRPTGEQRPFPYEQLLNGVAHRDDLYFVVLAKDL
jgi:ribosomal protein S18 acetylase RimI-like enzyme